MYLGVAYQASTLYATLFIGIRILHRVLQYIQPAVLKAYSEIFGIWLYGYELIPYSLQTPDTTPAAHII